MHFMNDYYSLGIVADAEACRDTDAVLSLNLQGVPLKQCLLAVTDAMGGKVCFVVRDYGILATTPQRAMEIYAPTIPADIPLLASAVPQE
jgi:hypothetical protein